MSPHGRHTNHRFHDRTEAGRLLGSELATDALANPVALGLVRGGIPVAAEVAQALGASLDMLAVRKIGAPGQPELGVGAVAEDGSYLFDDSAMSALGLTAEQLHTTCARELERTRELASLRDGPPTDVRGKDAIVVDDGLATGVTALAAIRSLRAHAPARVVFAAPVGSRQAVETLDTVADDVRCLLVPMSFRAVGEWYQNFSQVSDDEVRSALVAAREH